MGLLSFWKDNVVSVHHGVRAAQEWVEQSGGADFEVSEGTLRNLADATGASNEGAFINAFDATMEKEARREDAHAQGGLRGWLFG